MIKKAALFVLGSIFSLSLFSQQLYLFGPDEGSYTIRFLFDLPQELSLEQLVAQSQSGDLRVIPGKALVPVISGGAEIPDYLLYFKRTGDGLGYSGGIEALAPSRLAGSVVRLGSNPVITSSRMALSPLEVPASIEAIKIDQRFIEWIPLEDQLRIESNYRPPVVQRRREANVGLVTSDASLYWGLGGTRPTALKQLEHNNQLSLMWGSNSEITGGMGLRLHFYTIGDQERSGQAQNIATIELRVDDGSGSVVLWQPGEGPVIVGSFAHSTFFLELSIQWQLVPSSIQTLWRNGGVVELHSLFAEDGVEESFFIQNIFADVSGE